MKDIMLDTNVVIDIFYKREVALKKLSEFKNYRFCISHLVYVEFMSGMPLRNKKDGRKFLNELFFVLPYNSKCQESSILFCSNYFTGRENKPMDLMIAAHAKALNIPIITNNAKDFIFKDVVVYHYSKLFWN